jgi:glucose-1-phosphate thymidylyltransferase
MVLKGLIVPAGYSISGVRGASTALQPIANRPLVCHVLEELRGAGITEVVLLESAWEDVELRACVEADGLAGLDIEYLPYDESTFERALDRAAELVGDAACVVHVPDGLLSQPLAPLVELLRDDSPDLVALMYRSTASAGSIGLATRRLLRLVNAPHEDGALDLAGVSLFGPGALRRASETRWWQGRELDVVALAERLVDGGGRLHIEHVRGWRRYTGEVADLLELNRLALDALPREPAGMVGSAHGTGTPSGGKGTLDGGAGGIQDGDNRIEGCVEVHPTACVQSSVIVGPAIVGPGALVLESYIGPYTSIGANVRIEGAEVERSIILPGASITHIGGRLVGSVVGRDARVFRDFSLPRALRLNVGDGGEVALC